MSRRNLDEPLSVRIPADVDRPDKIVYGLTARQLVVLAVTGLAVMALYSTIGPVVPLPVLAALLLPIVTAGAVLAFSRRDGMPLDRFALAALVHARLPKTRVPAGEQVLPPPAWCQMRGELPAPLRLPVRAVRQDGVMDLDDGGTAAMVQAGTLSFGLRSSAEQAALVAAFGRWLNSLETPVQIVVQARAADLTGLAEHVTACAPDLPDPALEQAAHDHAAYLHQVSDSYDLLTRRVLIVIRDTGTRTRAAPSWMPSRFASGAVPWTRARASRAARRAGAALVHRRAAEAVRALHAIGVTARVLDADACAAVLAESLAPGEAPLAATAAPGEVITRMEEM
ncbi:PrgI family protein [Actinomadura parmotrematis]|uniref:PrgI family protein n=1 Tax=Actinomadura parmotrematis TaxID=2864039 RepID=A0ABS7G4Y7_9ACTN|nr:PrgI family protein [Actinomadura parmotrematis]MBW8487290.1 PrgI family protein [Actinomadura parmotrematis]